MFTSAASAPLVMPVPDCSFQPVDAGEVADRLASLAVGEPVGRTFGAYRAGAQLAPDQAAGKVTFADYLTGRSDVRNRSYRRPH